MLDGRDFAWQGETRIRPSEIVLRAEPPGHIALFHEWADSSRLTFWGFEQAHETGAVHRPIAFPYDDSARLYLPRRYRNLID